jgi:hypothetical protein
MWEKLITSNRNTICSFYVRDAVLARDKTHQLRVTWVMWASIGGHSEPSG